MKHSYLERVLFVEMSCKYGEWDVDDDDGENGRPDGHVVNQLLTDVVEHRRKVDRVDWCNEPVTEAAQQVAAELHSLRRHCLRLIIATIHFVNAFARGRHRALQNRISASCDSRPCSKCPPTNPVPAPESSK